MSWRPLEKDPEFLPDITPLWKDYRATVRGYLAWLQAARGQLDRDLEDEIDKQFDRVRDLRAYPFEVVELDAALQEEQVAEVFVRINSEGITLNQADFILTLTSVFRESWLPRVKDDLRRELAALQLCTLAHRARRLPGTAKPAQGIIARWFFMAHTTARYSGSFETRFEADVARLSGVAPGDAAGFIAVLDHVIRDTLTADYWAITLPNELATSASKSPALLAYIAALNILDADVLLSTSTVRSRLDPAITLKKGIERHHLFPKGYLKSALGIADTKRVNQIANFALVDWSDNIAISDLAPSAYWPAQVTAKGLDGERLQRATYWHALPEDWTELSYDEFLVQRRKRMALVVRDAIGRLADATYKPATPPSVSPVEAVERPTPSALSAFVDADLLPAGTTIVAGGNAQTHVAQVLPDGRLYADGEIYDSLIELSETLGLDGNPWSTWAAELADGRVQLSVLREAYDDGDEGTAA